ncbi:MAG: peptide-methionine (S)-S-oxide reductase MsrA [Planctomycetaceae bacterium]
MTEQQRTDRELATLAGGCFWCLEAVFEQVRGVEKVVSGYANGQTDAPTYQAVCEGDTGHAEVVQVTFDPREIGYGDLLEIFFAIHDPTTLNRQGADMGTQYRSAIFTHDAEQARVAQAKIAELNEEKIFDRPIVTQVEPLQQFYAGEGYHQGYFRAHPQQPYCQAVISPKVAKFRSKFASRLRAG